MRLQLNSGININMRCIEIIVMDGALDMETVD